jgi:hypothetical protein
MCSGSRDSLGDASEVESGIPLGEVSSRRITQRTI